MLCRELRPPIDIDVVGGFRRARPLGRGDENELFLDEQLDAQARRLPRRVDHRDVENTVGDTLQQVVRETDLGAYREMRRELAHAQQPVQQQRIPQAHLATDVHDRMPAGRHGHVLPCPLPQLNEACRVARKLFSCRRQRGAGLVADEQLAAEQTLERAQPRADGGLRDVQLLRGPLQAARRGNFEKGASEVDVHQVLQST